MRRVKKAAALLTALTLAAGLTACGLPFSALRGDTGSSGETEAAQDGGQASYAEPDLYSEAAVDGEITAAEADGTFSITTEDGCFTSSGNVYTIASAGTYVLSGYLEGQILVDAGEEDEVVLELAGVTIVWGEDSPVKAVSAGDLEISAKKDTENVIRDTRSAKTEEDDSQGEGAVWADCDLKLKGAGVLVVTGSYNNGIHTTKDLTIQKLTLKCEAYNNALKGNDSVTVKSGTVAAVSTNGDGVKTENTDLGRSGEGRGNITVLGGAVTVYAAGDGFQAARSFVMEAGEDGEPEVTVYTGSFSGYTAEDAEESSQKGVKVQDELIVRAGSIAVFSYDDGLHADAGTAFEDGTEGQGAVLISGGAVTLSVWSPESSAMGGPGGSGGFGGPGGHGGQQSFSGADGIHADGTLEISGGTVLIDSAWEGLEANVILISGGETRVAANDDGLNACKGASSPLVRVTGGYLDVAVSARGDVDGIDSNGSYEQTGGVVVARGPYSEMAAAVDAEGSVSVTGGTLIVLGYARVASGGNVRSVQLSLHGEGSHTVVIGGTSYTFENAEDYGATLCWSDAEVSS